jgi:small subunit ribosomal protein S1
VVIGFHGGTADMTDEERTPMQAEEQAQGTQAEQASTADTAASQQDQTEEQGGLLARLAATAKNAVSTVAEVVPDVAENVVGAAKHLVGREHVHAPDGTAVPVNDAGEPQPASDDASAGRSSVVETAGDVAQNVAETVGDAVQSATTRVRRVTARVYEAVAGGAGDEATTSDAPAATETTGATEGASFEPTEGTAKGGRPRRFKDVQAGMQLEGKVTSIALYGVFVDVGVGRDGLVHISEMSDTRVESPTELVKIGDPVTVWVKSVDADARRISLTMRDPNRPKPSRERRPRKPEVDLDRLGTMRAGDTVDGTISSLAPFGAFVDIGVGKDGLVHISELAEGRVEKPEDAVQVGDRYTFKILEVDPEGKRISLSLRRAQRTQRMQQLEPDTIMDGTISGIAPFGAFVDIGVGRDGLVHISELSADRVNSVEDVVKVGDKVQVKVIELDPNSKRISLTMRVDEPLPNDRERPAGRVGSAYSSGPELPDVAPAPSYGGGYANSPAGGFGGAERGGARGGRTGADRGGRGGGEGRGEGRGGRGGGRGGERDASRSGNRLGGGFGGGRGGRREGQVFEPAEEVYTFEDPEEETFTGDATLEDLLSKFNAGKNDRRRDKRDDEEDDDGDREGRGRRAAIRRTLGMDDE